MVRASDGNSVQPLDELVTDVAELSFGDLSDEVVRTVERAFVDVVGVTLAGAACPAGSIAADFAREGCDGGAATVFGRDAAAAPASAAFANGTAAHSLDYDDVSDAVSGHPSACLVPAIFAVAETDGANGRDAITAYVAGFEAAAVIAQRVLPGHYRRGWHATSTFGTFGAAAAAAHLLGADADEMRTAINVAASMPAGTKRNFGSMVKPMHAGQAARSGVTAASLACGGFEAADDAITGSGGFLDLYGEDDAAETVEYLALPERRALVASGLDFKKYPCCYFAQAPIEAASTLVAQHDLSHQEIEAIRVTVSPGAGDALSHRQPTSDNEAKFSAQYTVAYAVVHGHVGLDAFEDDALDDSVVDAVQRRIDLEIDQDLPYSSYETEVAITTDSGTTVRRSRRVPPGSHEDPLSDAELSEKFRECAGAADGEYAVDTIYDRLRSLSELSDVADVVDAL